MTRNLHQNNEAKLYVGDHVTKEILLMLFVHVNIPRDCVTNRASAYDNFNSVEDALKVMNGRFICNQRITVASAYKVKSNRGTSTATGARASWRRKEEERPYFVRIPLN
jgi:hypothetical protein